MRQATDPKAAKSVLFYGGRNGRGGTWRNGHAYWNCDQKQGVRTSTSLPARMNDYQATCWGSVDRLLWWQALQVKPWAARTLRKHDGHVQPGAGRGSMGGPLRWATADRGPTAEPGKHRPPFFAFSAWSGRSRPPQRLQRPRTPQSHMTPS